MSVKIKWNGNAIKAAVDGLRPKALFVAGSEWLTDSNNIAPQHRSELIKSSHLLVQRGYAILYYDTPYAFRLHEHPEYNFSKDVNSRAQGKYLERPLQWNYLRYMDSMAKIMKGAFKK